MGGARSAEARDDGGVGPDRRRAYNSRVTFRRLFLLFAVCLAVDFDDPVMVSPTVFEIEDDEDATEIRRSPLKKLEAARRERRPEDPVRWRRPRVVVAPVGRVPRAARSDWLVPFGRRHLWSYRPASPPEDH